MTENNENIKYFNEIDISHPVHTDLEINASNHGNHDNPEQGKFKNEDFDREVKNAKIINDQTHDTLVKDAQWQKHKPEINPDKSPKGEDEIINKDEIKRGGMDKTEERDDTREHRSKDANWPVDKMNEAIDQLGEKIKTDKDNSKEIAENDNNVKNTTATEEKIQKLKETREESVLAKPITVIAESKPDSKSSKSDHTY